MFFWAFGDAVLAGPVGLGCGGGCDVGELGTGSVCGMFEDLSRESAKPIAAEGSFGG